MAASECSLFSPEYLLETYLWILELTFRFQTLLSSPNALPLQTWTNH